MIQQSDCIRANASLHTEIYHVEASGPRSDEKLCRVIGPVICSGVAFGKIRA